MSKLHIETDSSSSVGQASLIFGGQFESATNEAAEKLQTVSTDLEQGF